MKNHADRPVRQPALKSQYFANSHLKYICTVLRIKPEARDENLVDEPSMTKVI